MIKCKSVSYADGNTPYNFDFNPHTNSLLNWFRENQIKANTNKCHILMSSDETCTAKIENFSIKNCQG